MYSKTIYLFYCTPDLSLISLLAISAGGSYQTRTGSDSQQRYQRKVRCTVEQINRFLSTGEGYASHLLISHVINTDGISIVGVVWFTNKVDIFPWMGSTVVVPITKERRKSI